MPPDSFLAGRSANGASPVLSQKLGDAPLPLGAGLPEQAGEELDVLADAEVGIEILAQTLRHVGDARTNRAAMPGIRHIAVEHEDAAGLDLARAGNDGEQRRLADPVGADQPDHAAGREGDRDVVERDDARHSAA